MFDRQNHSLKETFFPIHFEVQILKNLFYLKKNVKCGWGLVRKVSRIIPLYL